MIIENVDRKPISPSLLVSMHADDDNFSHLHMSVNGFCAKLKKCSG